MAFLTNENIYQHAFVPDMPVRAIPNFCREVFLQTCVTVCVWLSVVECAVLEIKAYRSMVDGEYRTTKFDFRESLRVFDLTQSLAAIFISQDFWSTIYNIIQ